MTAHGLMDGTEEKVSEPLGKPRSYSTIWTRVVSLLATRRGESVVVDFSDAYELER
jgi:hypothetical protein